MDYKQLKEARDWLEIELRRLRGVDIKKTMGGKSTRVTPQRDFGTERGIACTVLEIDETKKWGVYMHEKKRGQWRLAARDTMPISAEKAAEISGVFQRFIDEWVSEQYEDELLEELNEGAIK